MSVYQDHMSYKQICVYHIHMCYIQIYVYHIHICYIQMYVFLMCYIQICVYQNHMCYIQMCAYQIHMCYIQMSVYKNRMCYIQMCVNQNHIGYIPTKVAMSSSGSINQAQLLLAVCNWTCFPGFLNWLQVFWTGWWGPYRCNDPLKAIYFSNWPTHALNPLCWHASFMVLSWLHLLASERKIAD